MGQLRSAQASALASAQASALVSAPASALASALASSERFLERVSASLASVPGQELETALGMELVPADLPLKSTKLRDLCAVFRRCAVPRRHCSLSPYLPNYRGSPMPGPFLH